MIKTDSTISSRTRSICKWPCNRRCRQTRSMKSPLERSSFMRDGSSERRQSTRNASRSDCARRDAGDHPAAEAMGRLALIDGGLFVTLEPCPMCAERSSMPVSRSSYLVDRIESGAAAPFQLSTDSRLDHQCEVDPEVLGQQCGEVLTTLCRQCEPEE